MNLVTPFVDLIFPPLCLCCGESLLGGEELLCLNCLYELPRTNFHLNEKKNPVVQKFKGRLAIKHASSFLYFNKKGKTQRLIHLLKYKGKKKLGRLMGQWYALELSEVGWLDNINYIMPVPIHPKKRKRRGYNQARAIALGIGQQMSIPVAEKTILTKMKDTISQTKKSSLERLNNVKNVFRLNQQKQVEGRNVLLVDDVLTTGATLESCSLEILKGHPKSLSLLTLAIASNI